MIMATFEELGLEENILRGIREMGFENPTPIQQEVIPMILTEKTDLVALAQTGTGKTAAFGLPILQNIDRKRQEPQALILSPTRELCVQIAGEMKSYGKFVDNLKVVALYGGEPIVKQFKLLDNPPQVIAATPGRLLDMIRRGRINLETIDFLVLDEADEMLNMGFTEDINQILESVSDARQTLLFSATMPKAVSRIAQNYMKNPQEVTVGTKNSGSDNVTHEYYMVQARNRYQALKRIVDINPDVYGIIFCRTRQETKEIAEKLMQDGYNADALHGDLSQAQRDTVMNKFRMRNLQLLVATDVASRGLDVNDLTHVINYNLPDDTESYNHRSGRTGRADKKGTSVAIVHQREKYRIRDIERIIKKEFIRKDIPNGEDVCRKQLIHFIDRIEQAQIDSEIEAFMPEISEKLAQMDRETLVRNVVGLEFTRLLGYYKNAPNLNVAPKDERKQDNKDRNRERSRENGRRYERGSEQRTSERGNERRRGLHDGVRLFMNMGEKQGLKPSKLLGMINDATGDKSIEVQNIDVMKSFAFFEVSEQYAGQIIAGFAREFADKNIAIERAQAGAGNDGQRRESKKDSYSSNERRGSYGGRNRSGGNERGGERRPRRRKR